MYRFSGSLFFVDVWADLGGILDRFSMFYRDNKFVKFSKFLVAWNGLRFYLYSEVFVFLVFFGEFSQGAGNKAVYIGPCLVIH